MGGAVMLGALQLIAGLAVVPRPTRGPDRDAELVERLRDGDHGAFAELYARHVDAVYARITRLLGPVAGAEAKVKVTVLGWTTQAGSTTPRVKPSTRARGFSGSATRAERRSTGSPARAIRRPTASPLPASRAWTFRSQA